MWEVSDESSHITTPSLHSALPNNKRSRRTISAAVPLTVKCGTTASSEHVNSACIKQAVSSSPMAAASPSPVESAAALLPAFWHPNTIVIGVPLNAYAAAWTTAAMVMAHASFQPISPTLPMADPYAPTAPTLLTNAPATPAEDGGNAAELSQLWHSPEDTLCRVRIARLLLRLLRNRGLVKAVGDLRSLHAVQQMELLLYRRAGSRAAYVNVNSLESRIVVLLEDKAVERRALAVVLPTCPQ